MTRLVRLLGVRPGEGPLVALVAGLFAAIEAARGFGEIGVDTLLLSRFGAAALPVLFIGLGTTSLVAAVAYGAALGRIRRGPLFIGLLAGAGALLIVEQLMLVAGAAAVLPALWLSVYAAGTIAGTIAWTLAGGLLDARQAKRLFPIFTGAAIAGSFAGTLGAGPVARLAGTEALVVAEAGLLVVAAALIGRVAASGAGGRLRAPRAARSIAAELRAGFDEVVRSPLMRLVAVAYVLFSVLMFSVTFPFLTAMQAAFPAEADLATALGLLSAAVTATSFVVSLAIAPRLYARFGVATAALALPLVYLAGFGLWIAQFTVATAVVFRFAQQVIQRGVSNAAWSAFYNVVPATKRAQVLAFNDGVPGQIGIALSGILLLAAGRLLAPDQVFWLGAVAALLCTLAVLGIRRSYGSSLVRTLRAGFGRAHARGRSGPRGAGGRRPGRPDPGHGARGTPAGGPPDGGAAAGPGRDEPWRDRAGVEGRRPGSGCPCRGPRRARGPWSGVARGGRGGTPLRRPRCPGAAGGGPRDGGARRAGGHGRGGRPLGRPRSRRAGRPRRSR